MSKKLRLLLVALILGFGLWYFKVHRKHIFISDSSNFPHTGAISEHVIWGYPLNSQGKIFKYNGLSLAYNDSRKTADWVSYHITDDYISGEKFLDKRKFKPDPTLDKDTRITTNDYTRSGFDRGHLAAQADMRGRNIDTELEACYMTNIAPQKPEFNRRTWLNLEKAVRNWTNRYGESWILTGPVYDNDHSYIKDKIEIPDAFYKIIVVKDESTYRFNSFVMYQEDKSMNLEEYLVNIDSVEKATGLDFFSELQDNLEDNIESYTYSIIPGWR